MHPDMSFLAPPQPITRHLFRSTKLSPTVTLLSPFSSFPASAFLLFPAPNIFHFVYVKSFSSLSLAIFLVNSFIQFFHSIFSCLRPPGLRNHVLIISIDPPLSFLSTLPTVTTAAWLSRRVVLASQFVYLRPDPTDGSGGSSKSIHSIHNILQLQLVNLPVDIQQHPKRDFSRFHSSPCVEIRVCIVATFVSKFANLLQFSVLLSSLPFAPSSPKVVARSQCVCVCVVRQLEVCARTTT